ncbi:Disp Complex Protein Lrch3 [Manis pentadactyla]|nr:Disp Complex Protein Lrch3 [Manis pentadactyla]
MTSTAFKLSSSNSFYGEKQTKQPQEKLLPEYEQALYMSRGNTAAEQSPGHRSSRSSSLGPVTVGAEAVSGSNKRD